MHIVASRRTYAHIKKKRFSVRGVSSGVSSGVSNRKSSASASHFVAEGVAKYVAAFFLASLGIRDQGSRVRAGRTCSTLLCFVFCCPFLQVPTDLCISQHSPSRRRDACARFLPGRILVCRAIQSTAVHMHTTQQTHAAYCCCTTRTNALSLRDPDSR